MIVRERPSFLTLLFIMKGSVVPKILPQIPLVVSLSCVVLIADAYSSDVPPPHQFAWHWVGYGP